MVEPELLELMVDTVTLSPVTGKNGVGERVYGSPVTVQARVEDDAQYAGGVQFADGVAYLADVYAVTPDWKMQLNGDELHVLRVNQLKDENGPYSTVVYYGARR